MDNTEHEQAAYIAVFGDIHGRVELMYILSRLWERHTGHHLQAILQVGDIGAYPDHTTLDGATLKYAKHDPDELGFLPFCYRSEEGERIHATGDMPDAYCIRGNHEDFSFLQQFKEPTAFDPWEKLWYIPDGCIVDIPIREVEGLQSIRVAGFGGIDPPSEERGRGKKARKVHRRAKEKTRDPKYFKTDDIHWSFMGLKDIDILLTHAGPQSDAFERGSTHLARLAERLEPRCHFFGHHHEIIGPTEGPGGSSLVGLEHLDFDRNHRLKDASWGILRMTKQEVSFTFADHETFTWLNEVQRTTYRQLL